MLTGEERDEKWMNWAESSILTVLSSEQLITVEMFFALQMYSMSVIPLKSVALT